MANFLTTAEKKRKGVGKPGGWEWWWPAAGQQDWGPHHGLANSRDDLLYTGMKMRGGI